MVACMRRMREGDPLLVRLLVLSVPLLLCCCGSAVPALTPVELGKLDPPLQRLLLGGEVIETDYNVTTGPSGERRYVVVARVETVDEVKKAGFEVTSAFGEIAVVQVTVDQLRVLVAMPGVKNVRTGSKNQIQ